MISSFESHVEVYNNKVNFNIYQGKQGAKGERGAVGAKGSIGNGTSCDCMGKQTALEMQDFCAGNCFYKR